MCICVVCGRAMPRQRRVDIHVGYTSGSQNRLCNFHHNFTGSGHRSRLFPCEAAAFCSAYAAPGDTICKGGRKGQAALGTFYAAMDVKPLSNIVDYSRDLKRYVCFLPLHLVHTYPADEPCYTRNRVYSGELTLLDSRCCTYVCP